MDPDTVVQVLRAFFAAFNQGDFAAVERLLSPEFYSYSVTLPGPNHFVAWQEADALANLRSRHAAGDKMLFTTARVSELKAWDGAAHFGYVELTLVRDGRDIRLGGKGALFCDGTARGIKVLALGAPE